MINNNEPHSQKVEVGSLDYCLESILEVFTDEILGLMYEEKEA